MCSVYVIFPQGESRLVKKPTIFTPVSWIFPLLFSDPWGDGDNTPTYTIHENRGQSVHREVNN